MDIVTVTSNITLLVDYLTRRRKKAGPADTELFSVCKGVCALLQTGLNNQTCLERPRSVTGISV